MPQFLRYRDERTYKPYRQNVSLVIPNGHSISSDYIDLEDCWTVVGLYLPDAWTECYLNFLTVYPLVTATEDPTVPVTGNVWRTVYDYEGNLINVAGPAGTYVTIPPDMLCGCRYLRLVSGDGEGGAEPQGGTRTVIIVVRPI